MSARLNPSYTPPMLRCPKCNSTFHNNNLLRTHQHHAGHLPCGSCEASFHTIQALLIHRRDDHKAIQDLTCPGCSRSFTATGQWVHHIESGQCGRIFPSDLFQGVAKVMDIITKNLAKTRLQSEDYVDFSGPSHIRDVWGDEWADSQSFDVRKNPGKFPRVGKHEYYHGDSKEPNLLTGDGANDLAQKPGNAWAQKKNLFPENDKKLVATPAPQPYVLKKPEEPASSGRPTGERILDPHHKDFNVAVFWNPILETYTCPHRTCKSKFNRSNGLISHLKSSVHSGIRFNCPGCRVAYTSIFAWVQHVETVSLSKCRLRNSREIYGYALKEITHGALDIDTLCELPNSTAKVKVVEEWAKGKEPPKKGFVPGTNEYANAKQAEASKDRRENAS
ncbi:hypothetical protein F5B19DRAFT_492570 [Rostrohypoxylon terebratum]|nr:hypothetical protein F5B19DRAFT_492570 [Rostrohypoxylon terebratum]